MNIDAAANDFQRVFTENFSPHLAYQTINILENACAKASKFCKGEFKAGNYGITEGLIRRQYIANELKLQVLDGYPMAETRDFFEAKLLSGEDRANGFVLLRSENAALVFCKVRRKDDIPKPTRARRRLIESGYQSGYLQRWLFSDPNTRGEDTLRALYIVRYCVEFDEDGTSEISAADVIVTTHDGKSIFCPICNLYEYAKPAVEQVSHEIIANDLPIVPKPSTLEPLPEEQNDENLPLSFLDERDE